ncbi:hypothetical protein REPUB_Repub14bG0058900 [Reevesia pubescens]
MEILKHLFIAVAVLSYFCPFALLIRAQPGFISLDCGLPKDESYNDTKTGIFYTSDAIFVESDSGKSMTLSPEFGTSSLQKQLYYVRSFPQGSRNCYNIKVSGGQKYLIRARFMYGNYDGQGKVPQFELHLEANLWDTVKLQDASTAVTKEIIHIPSVDYLYVCLVNTGLGIPFISALELRHLENDTYVAEAGSLALMFRYDVASTTNQTVRYADDDYDRIWKPYNYFAWAQTNSSVNFNSETNNVYHLPSMVMRTAATPRNASHPLDLFFYSANPISKFYVYLHFVELEKLQANPSREFDIYLNGELWFGSFAPIYLEEITIYNIISLKPGTNQFSFIKTLNSTLPPILNAIEVYTVNTLSQSQTNKRDVDAIMKIKSIYGVKRNWQGDPCAPADYLWDGINCCYHSYDPPAIISLNLSSSGLTGKIPPFLSNLTSIQHLDLSDNSLTGSVPDFLTRLSSLTVLNLTGNNLTGSIPAKLLERSKQGLLSLSLAANPNLCSSISCSKKKKFIVAVVALISAISFIIITVLAVVWVLKRRKQVWRVKHKTRFESLKSRTQQFTYSEVRKITNNFEKILGKGGFGTVYHGYLGDTQVAVKMLSPSSAQGYKQFQAEVELLLTVHHKNLTALVGYCNQDPNMGLIYEYMANGNLGDYLSDSSADTLSWEGRLRIAMESGQGLEYLHNGCKPPIVHRDVKTANILLNDKFQAKLADFGLSRYFPTESGTHVSTTFAGTHGYLDPDCYGSNRLTEKSDVYSFGVVLLEIITGKPAIMRAEDQNEAIHISKWTNLKLVEGDIGNIVDERLQGNFDANSAWKALEIAMACVSPTSSQRPAMNHVVMELEDCLATEVARKAKRHESEGNDSIEMITTVNLETESSIPLAR